MNPLKNPDRQAEVHRNNFSSPIVTKSEPESLLPIHILTIDKYLNVFSELNLNDDRMNRVNWAFYEERAKDLSDDEKATYGMFLLCERVSYHDREFCQSYPGWASDFMRSRFWFNVPTRWYLNSVFTERNSETVEKYWNYLCQTDTEGNHQRCAYFFHHQFGIALNEARKIYPGLLKKEDVKRFL